MFLVSKRHPHVPCPGRPMTVRLLWIVQVLFVCIVHCSSHFIVPVTVVPATIVLATLLFQPLLFQPLLFQPLYCSSHFIVPVTVFQATLLFQPLLFQPRYCDILIWESHLDLAQISSFCFALNKISTNNFASLHL